MINTIKNSTILHIPHSKTAIPKKYMKDYMNLELVENDINLLTDFSTDIIFDINGLDKIVFPYSRVFCDVERLDDENEIMYSKGRGFYYTKTDDGIVFRNENSKDNVYNKYYKKHHTKLLNKVDSKLKKYGFATIIDCHSFSNTPFNSDLEKGKKRPDFCIGTDEFHTPYWLTNIFYNYLSKDYNVEINYPYSGTIVPIEHYNKNKNVYSIMIEVNRDLYVDGTLELEKLFNNIFNNI